MKRFSALCLTATLIFVMAPPASAYHLSPTNIRAKLRGTLTFYYQGGQEAFKCKVVFELRTKNNAAGITHAKTGGNKDCLFPEFVGLPWVVGILNANSGQFGHFAFIGGGGQCTEGVELFTDNASGIWKLPTGECVSGSLTSDPPVTIVR
jgi:hypothetical protein